MRSQDVENAIQLYEVGSYAACFPTLLEAANAGDVALQSVVGTILIRGMHLFSSQDEYVKWEKGASAEEREMFLVNYRADIEQGVWLLKSASQKGNPFASMNLATYYSEQFRRTGDEIDSSLAHTYWQKGEEQKKDYVW